MINVVIGLIIGVPIGAVAVITWALAAAGGEYMRTRELNYESYGLFPGDADKVKEYCQRTLDPSDRIRLFQCALNAAPGLEMDIYESLTTGRGYRTIIKSRNIPAKEEDFYAYKRKAIAEFYDWLRLTGKWKDFSQTERQDTKCQQEKN